MKGTPLTEAVKQLIGNKFVDAIKRVTDARCTELSASASASDLHLHHQALPPPLLMFHNNEQNL